MAKSKYWNGIAWEVLGTDASKVTEETDKNFVTDAEKTKIANALTSVTKTHVGLGSVMNYGIATQAEAEAGTSDVKYMTPLKSLQSVRRLSGVAPLLAQGVKLVGNVVYSSNQTVSSSIVYCTNFTINAGVTLTVNNYLYVYATGTITINGTINAVNPNSGYLSTINSGSGGNGAGIVLLIAPTVTGTGTINANGANGTAGAAASGKYNSIGWYGGGGLILDIALGTNSASNPVTSKIAEVRRGGCFPKLSDIGVNGGGAGVGSNLDQTSACAGGPGGHGGYGAGGFIAYESANKAGPCSGGGGGGGGGMILIFAYSVSLNSIQAKGGNGGAAGIRGTPGGGGGGGYIGVFAESISVTSTSVIAGTGHVAGGAGLAQLITTV